MGKRAKPSDVIAELPVDAINLTLGLRLDPGAVVFSRGARKHARDRHPENYHLYEPHIPSIVTHPLYVGNDFKNPGKIELIGKTSSAGYVLVAVVVEGCRPGEYVVASAYTMKEERVQQRKNKGFLKVCLFP